MRSRSVLLAATACLALGWANQSVYAQSVYAQGAAPAQGVPPGQSPSQSPVVGATADVDVTSVRAKVTRIDAKDRKLTLRGPAGNHFQVTAGPEVRNFAQIKKGDEVVARFVESVAIVITKPGTKLPDVMVSDAGVRAAPGEKPAGAVGRRIAITGLIVGIDPVGHVLSVVDQHGGPVRQLMVRDPERQAAMKSLKVGDMMTVVFTEAVAVAVEPAVKS